MGHEVTMRALANMLGVSKQTISELAKREIIMKGIKRGGTYLLHESVAGYCQNLREQAAGRGGEDAAAASARLGQAQARLAETKARQLETRFLNLLRTIDLVGRQRMCFFLGLPLFGGKFVPRRQE